MIRTKSSERGITIIETTVVLSVLFILAGAMSPIVAESVGTARAVRAKNDAMMIAMALINLQKDLGVASAAAVSSLAAQTPRLPGVLASAGGAPEIDDPEQSDGESGILALCSGPEQGRGNGNGRRPGPRAERRKWREASTGNIDDHLKTNRRGYRYRRPGEHSGWNGPYISAQIKGDPWGRQYLINTEWLDGGSTAADSNGDPRRAVFVVSPGANGVIETPYEQPITDAQPMGDDIVVRIQ